MALWIEDLVMKNKFSRPAHKLLSVKGIVMHWTGTAGAGDENHQKFFDGADGGGSRYASAHLFVDRDSARLIIPLDEVAYHANEKPCKVEKLEATASYYKNGCANLTTIGLEMCVEKDGTIHPDTIKRSAEIVAELCKTFKLDPLKDIYRHHDITGKNCPAPWVTDPAKFTAFKSQVKSIVSGKTAPAKPKLAPKATPKVEEGDAPDVYGVITVLADKLNLREQPDLNSKVSRVLSKGETYKVYGQKNGLYVLGNKAYTTSNPKYVKFVKNEHFGEAKKLKVIVDSLYYYDKPDWDAKSGQVKKGDVFTITKELTIDGAKMYLLKSGVYITASAKYVQVI